MTETFLQSSEKIQWSSCKSLSKWLWGVQCGFLSVPLNHGDPNGTKIKIALSRIRHTVHETEYQGVVLMNFGGPGAPGLDTGYRVDMIPKSITGAYDWIGFDPRGVGSSSPTIKCVEDKTVAKPTSLIPSTEEIEAVWLNKIQSFIDSCRGNGEILDHMKTTDVAKDMDLIRIALGESQINFYGFSYGSYLGQVYATLFPTRVRRMILDSNLDPTKVWYQSTLDQVESMSRPFKQWIKWMAENDDYYGLGDTESQVMKHWSRVIEQLREKPILYIIGPNEWFYAFQLVSYSVKMWPDYAAAFSDWAKHANFSLVYSLYKQNPMESAVSFPVFISVICTDAQYPQDWESIKKTIWLFHSQNFTRAWDSGWAIATCLKWPGKPGTPVYVDGKNNNSILLIGEYFDGPTPFEGSLKVRELFPNSRLVEVPDGAGHANSLTGNNECVSKHIHQFLASGTLPKRKQGNIADVLCPLDENSRPKPSRPIPRWLNSIISHRVAHKLVFLTKFSFILIIICCTCCCRCICSRRSRRRQTNSQHLDSTEKAEVLEPLNA